MNRLTTQKRIQVVASMVEGSSINSTVRMTGVSKPTILKLLADLGAACAKYQDEKLGDLPCKRVQADEIWSFCFAKDKNLSEEMKGKFSFGNVWTWTAICADTKLMVSWLAGERSVPYAVKFIDDLASRLAHRVQLTTDGHKSYLRAVVSARLAPKSTMPCRRLPSVETVWKSVDGARHRVFRKYLDGNYGNGRGRRLVSECR